MPSASWDEGHSPTQPALPKWDEVCGWESSIHRACLPLWQHVGACWEQLCHPEAASLVRGLKVVWDLGWVTQEGQQLVHPESQATRCPQGTSVLGSNFPMAPSALRIHSGPPGLGIIRHLWQALWRQRSTTPWGPDADGHSGVPGVSAWHKRCVVVVQGWALIHWAFPGSRSIPVKHLWAGKRPWGSFPQPCCLPHGRVLFPSALVSRYSGVN